MLELCIEINKINTGAVPNYYAGIILDKLYQLNQEKFNTVLELQGNLGKLAEKYIVSIERPRSVFRLNPSTFDTNNSTKRRVKSSEYSDLSE